MQKPNSVTGQACLSSTVLTVHNILLLAGVISRIALQSLCHRYSDGDVSLFYPRIVIISCIGTAVLLVLIYLVRIKNNADEYEKFIYVANSSFRHIFLRHAFGIRVLGSKANQRFQPGNSNTDSHQSSASPSPWTVHDETVRGRPDQPASSWLNRGTRILRLTVLVNS